VGFEIEVRAETPEPIGGVVGWRFGAHGARALFLGRGAPGRDGAWPEGLLPVGVDRSWLRQVHSDRVVDAVPGPCGEGDALVARRARLAAQIATADCVPILIAGPDVVVAVHAGWRGLAAGVIGAAMARLGASGAPVAWIGPAIGPCCYEVAPEVETEVVAASFPGVSRPGPRGRPHLDLGAAATEQLRRAGVERVVRVAACTRCRPEWLWSHRGDGPAAGRNLALVWREG